jgi:hypothetical protein
VRLRRAPIDPARYQRTGFGRLGYVEHLDGQEWHMCDPPPRWHRCWPQSRWYDTVRGEWDERCACGGVRLDREHPWIDRNTHSAPTAAQRADYERGRYWDALMREFEEAVRSDPVRAAEIREELTRLADSA